MAAEKKKLTHPLSDAGQARTYFAKLVAFLLYILTSSPSLFYKRNWHLDPNKMVLGDANPPSSWSAGFLYTVAIPSLNTSFPDLLACRVVSSVSLDLVTMARVSP